MNSNNEKETLVELWELFTAQHFPWLCGISHCLLSPLPVWTLPAGFVVTVWRRFGVPGSLFSLSHMAAMFFVRFAFTGGKRWKLKTIPVYHHAACLIYVTAHSKQLFVNNIFMPSIDFYEYHKTKSSWCYLLCFPHTHTHTMLLNQICQGVCDMCEY